jgi:uncharacterized membrane protein
MVLFGIVNQVAAVLIPADILIICIGLAGIAIGVFTNRKNPLIHY